MLRTETYLHVPEWDSKILIIEDLLFAYETYAFHFLVGWKRAALPRRGKTGRLPPALGTRGNSKSYNMVLWRVLNVITTSSGSTVLHKPQAPKNLLASLVAWLTYINHSTRKITHFSCLLSHRSANGFWINFADTERRAISA